MKEQERNLVFKVKIQDKLYLSSFSLVFAKLLSKVVLLDTFILFLLVNRFFKNQTLNFDHGMLEK